MKCERDAKKITMIFDSVVGRGSLLFRMSHKHVVTHYLTRSCFKEYQRVQNSKLIRQTQFKHVSHKSSNISQLWIGETAWEQRGWPAISENLTQYDPSPCGSRYNRDDRHCYSVSVYLIITTGPTVQYSTAITVTGKLSRENLTSFILYELCFHSLCSYTFSSYLLTNSLWHTRNWRSFL